MKFPHSTHYNSISKVKTKKQAKISDRNRKIETSCCRLTRLHGDSTQSRVSGEAERYRSKDSSCLWDGNAALLMSNFTTTPIRIPFDGSRKFQMTRLKWVSKSITNPYQSIHFVLLSSNDGSKQKEYWLTHQRILPIAYRKYVGQHSHYSSAVAAQPCTTAVSLSQISIDGTVLNGQAYTTARCKDVEQEYRAFTKQWLENKLWCEKKKSEWVL